MKNKLLSLLLTAALLTACMPMCAEQAFAATPEICISNAKAAPGQSAAITVSLAGNPGITSIDFFVEYDAAQLELTATENGKLLEGTLNSETLDKVPYYCGWINSLQKENCKEDGILITLTFKVKSKAAEGRHAISFKKNTITGYDADIKEVDFSAVNGYIEVTSKGTSQNPSVLPGGLPETPEKPDEAKPEQARDGEGDKAQTLTAKEQKTIESVKSMKVTFASAKYNKTKKTYTLKYRKSNKAFKLDGYQIYRSSKANKGFKKIATTFKSTWTDKKPGRKGSIRYYKVRGFRKIADKTYYTNWSTKKKLTVS